MPHHNRPLENRHIPIGKLLRLAGNTIVAHSQVPLKFTAIIGLVIAVLSFIAAIAIIARVLIWGVSVTGWASLIVAVFMIGGIQIFLTGVVGLYVGKCFEEAKRRPLYFIRANVEFLMHLVAAVHLSRPASLESGVRDLWCCPKCESDLHLVCIDCPPIDCKCHACGFQIVHYDGFPCFAPEQLESAEGFDPALFQMLARIEETNFWFVNRAHLIVILLQKYFPTAGNFLEVGCGTGSVLLALRSRNAEAAAGRQRTDIRVDCRSRVIGSAMCSWCSWTLEGFRRVPNSMSSALSTSSSISTRMMRFSRKFIPPSSRAAA